MIVQTNTGVVPTKSMSRNASQTVLTESISHSASLTVLTESMSRSASLTPICSSQTSSFPYTKYNTSIYVTTTERTKSFLVDF